MACFWLIWFNSECSLFTIHLCPSTMNCSLFIIHLCPWIMNCSIFTIHALLCPSTMNCSIFIVQLWFWVNDQGWPRLPLGKKLTDTKRQRFQMLSVVHWSICPSHHTLSHCDLLYCVHSVARSCAVKAATPEVLHWRNESCHIISTKLYGNGSRTLGLEPHVTRRGNHQKIKIAKWRWDTLERAAACQVQ